MIALEPGRPCQYCDVRPDVACRHRPADPTWRKVEQPEGGDGRKNNGGDRRSKGSRSSGEFAQLNGYRKFTMAADGKTYRIKGRGE